MNDEMDLAFDAMARRRLQAVALPPAPGSLRRTLDELPRTAGAARAGSSRRVAVGLLAAGIVIAVVGLNNLFGPSAFVPGPGASPTPSASPRPTASPAGSTFPAYSIASLLAGRADGSIGDDPVIAFGWYSDLRDVSADPCPSPAPSATVADCLDLRQGLTDAEEAVGTVVDGHWTPTTSPALHPVWPARLGEDARVARFFAITGPGQPNRQPIFVLLTGHFNSDTFVVDDVLQFDDPFAEATPGPSATPFPSSSLPPPPARMLNCTEPRSPEAAASGDPIPRRLASQGWVAKTDVPFPFLGVALTEDVVYFGVVEGDIPLGIWLDDADGSGRYRWWGTSTCVADSNGIFYGWLPGSTYRVYEDGHRVDGGDPFDPQPSPSRT